MVMSIIWRRKAMLTFISTGTEQPQWVFAANLAGRAVGEDKVHIYQRNLRTTHSLHPSL
jgi:hypothetical protein